MTRLLSLWLDKKEFFEDKTVEQILSMSGDGVLKDDSSASSQLRELFSNIPSSYIVRYIEECLDKPSPQGGFLLQDLVNEVGKRLGFDITHGFYRGGGAKIGFDGIWQARDGYGFVIEVKTTDAYQINLDVQAQYRKRLIEDGRVAGNNSSILLVVGRKDTGGLEAQTRGSRHAWDIRIISIDALLKLLKIKENLNNSATVSQIQEVLKPIEYTRVDQLIQIIFKASEDIRVEEPELDEGDSDETERTRKSPVNYYDACVNRISSKWGVPLIRQGRCLYSNADQSVRLICSVSKEYQRSGAVRYWYAFHPSQEEFLAGGKNSHISFGCGSANQLILMPFEEFKKYLPVMRKTESDGRFYWHVEIFRKAGRYLLNKATHEGVDVTAYRLE